MWRNITWVSVLIYCLKKEGEVGEEGEGGWEEGEVGRRRRRRGGERGGGMGEKGEGRANRMTVNDDVIYRSNLTTLLTTCTCIFGLL